MPESPKEASGSRIFNIIAALRGNFDFNVKAQSSKTIAYGAPELISKEERSKILGGAFRAVDTNHQSVSGASVLTIAQTSLNRVGSERLENRKILQLMPEVDKAAKLMIASTFAPNDLTRRNIPVIFETDDIIDTYKDRINDYATNFFQKKLNLKTSAPSWVYQWGYEAGSCVFAIVPLRSFEYIQEQSYAGLEDFVSKVIDPVANTSLFGFGDDFNTSKSFTQEALGLESYTHDLFKDFIPEEKKSSFQNSPQEVKALVEMMIAKEALSLTDNPSILQANTVAKEKSEKRTKDVLYRNFKRPKADPILSIPSQKDPLENGGVVGNPILLRLPPESVTVIHTPGDPNDHQGYLVLLDHLGNPINAVIQEEDLRTLSSSNSSNQGNIFSQVYKAYGLTSGFHGVSNEETMNRIYTQIISTHIKKRINKAGYANIALGNVDSVFRCMFARFLQQKQTRVLFLPKDLVSYMTFEMDQNGYGVSRLDRIKFALGMKMAVQVARVLAAIKAAMDRRKIEIKFTDNLLEQPEAVFQNVIREYLNKSTMSFSIDPNVIQNQIADKSVSIKGIDIPGCEQFDLTNEPDQRTSSVDFDPSLLEYLDKSIINGLHVPASTMNSLSEDEYARSVATTNLFFAMDISADQDIVIKCVSDLLRKYARFSEEFVNGIYEIFPSLNTEKDSSSTDEVLIDGKEEEEYGYTLPEYYTVDRLIDEMSIALPHPNVAPSKAQFEVLDAMIQSISNTVNALFPDDLMGADDTLGSTIRLLRAKFTTMNIRNYLESSGMNGIEVPDSSFSDEMGEIIKLTEALQNVSKMLEDKAKITAAVEDTGTEIDGYQ